MFEFIVGNIVEANPAYAVVENNGIGYFVNISLNTFSRLNGEGVQKLFIHQIIREDTNALYGFADKKERNIFRFLISVSGVGANTGRMMLSSLSAEELENAILTDNVVVLKKIKGIGAKTAQRIIIELKDKLGKTGNATELPLLQTDTTKEESLSALTMLGFTKKAVEKTVDKILASDPKLSVEEVVKLSLKNL